MFRHFVTRAGLRDNLAMTALLKRAIERVRALPPEAQDDFARILLRLAGDRETVYDLTTWQMPSDTSSKGAR